VLNPIPGQEAANSDFLLEHGAAAKANRVEDLPFRLEQLIGSPKLAAMAKAAQSLGQIGKRQRKSVEKYWIAWESRTTIELCAAG